jgi:PAS domain-containing protein
MTGRYNFKKHKYIYVVLVGFLLIGSFILYQWYHTGKYNVLVIHSYYESYKWGDRLNDGIEDGFKKNNLSVNITNFYLGAESSRNSANGDTLVHFLDGYGDTPPDLILVCDDQATMSLLLSEHKYSHTVPIVFCGVDYMDSSLLEHHSNITGFFDTPDFVKCYQLARRLFGRITDVILIAEDDAYMGRVAIEDSRAQFSSLSNLTEIYETFPAYNKIDTLASARAVVNPFSLHIERIDQLTGEGLKDVLYYKLYSFCILHKWSSNYSSMPKMGTAPFLMVNNEGFGDGRIGGYMTPAYNQAFDAADVGSKVLKGARVSDFPIRQSEQYPLFDWNELQYWKIDLSLLPEGSIIPNMPFFIRYKVPIIASSIIASLFLLLFISLLTRFYRRESYNKKQIQRNLLKEQHELDITVDSLNEGVIAVDAGGQVLSINSAAVEWLQLDKNVTYIGYSIWSLFDIQEKDNPFYLRDLVAEYSNSTEKSSWLKDTAYAITANKKVFPVSGNISSLNAESKTPGVVLTFRDITNEYTQKQYLALSMISGDVFAWRYDQNNNRIYFDESFFELFQIKDDGTHSVAVEDFMTAIHPDDFPLWRETMDCVLDGTITKGFLQFRMNLNGQGYIWWEYRISLSTSITEDSSFKYVGICLNVEQFKQTEEELIRLKEEAEKSDQMKGIFLANMSHEVRTPLNAIVGFSSILIDNQDLPSDERKEFINIINENCRLLLKLINEILDISRIESGIYFREEECDLNEVIKEVISMNEASQPESIQLINLPVKER